MSVVVDASVALAWVFASERTPHTEAVLSRTVEQGAVVPSLWRLEVANVLHQAVRRGRMDAATRDASLADLLALPIRIDDETDARAWVDTLSLADRTGLTLYDAAYLELAMRLHLPLATTGKALRQAATAENIAVLGA